jgi:hypothetical protein
MEPVGTKLESSAHLVVPAVVRFGDRGSDHVERAPRAPSRRALGISRFPRRKQAMPRFILSSLRPIPMASYQNSVTPITNFPIAPPPATNPQNPIP